MLKLKYGLQGAVADVSPNATAFFWRSALFESQWYYYWENGNQAGKVPPKIRSYPVFVASDSDPLQSIVNGLTCTLC